MSTLLATLGLPGSGKSTWARSWAAAGPDRVTCSRDDVRMALGLPAHGTPEQEARVTEAQHERITAALAAGVDVCADDTNLRSGNLAGLAVLAKASGARFVVVDLTGVPASVCRARNDARVGRTRVPDDAMDFLESLLPASVDAAWAGPWPVVVPDEVPTR